MPTLNFTWSRIKCFKCNTNTDECDGIFRVQILRPQTNIYSSIKLLESNWSSSRNRDALKHCLCRLKLSENSKQFLHSLSNRFWFDLMRKESECDEREMILNCFYCVKNFTPIFKYNEHVICHGKNGEKAKQKKPWARTIKGRSQANDISASIAFVNLRRSPKKRNINAFRVFIISIPQKEEKIETKDF